MQPGDKFQYKKPWFPLYGSDWLEATAEMEPEAQGVYMRLLAAQWLKPTCTLPADERKLARIVGCRATWKRVRDEVLQKFTKTDHPEAGEIIYNDRLWNERVKSETVSQKRADARRARDDEDRNEPTNAGANESTNAHTVTGTVTDTYTDQRLALSPDRERGGEPEAVGDIEVPGVTSLADDISRLTGEGRGKWQRVIDACVQQGHADTIIDTYERAKQATNGDLAASKGLAPFKNPGAGIIAELKKAGVKFKGRPQDGGSRDAARPPP